MKKLLIILSLLAIISCNKEEDKTLPLEQQKIENAKLVGTWRSEALISESNRHYYVFTEDFTFSFYTIHEATETTKYTYTDEPYTIPRIGWIDFTLLSNNGRGYRFEGGSLFITDNAWEIEFKKIK